MSRHQKDMPQQLLVTVPQAAKMLGVSRATIYRLVSKGELRLLHIGSAARVNVNSIRQLIQAHERDEDAR
jgi:excisionase family DNA binding protein